MYNNNDYPLGADNSGAPWNEDVVDREFTVSITLSKTFNLQCDKKVDDMSDSELEEYIFSRINLGFPKDWNIDDTALIME